MGDIGFQSSTEDIDRTARVVCLHTFQRDFFDGLRIDVVGIGRSGLGSGVVVGRGWRGCIRRHAPVLLPSSADAIQPDAFFQHAHSDAFLEAAGLASLPPALIDLAIVGGRARVFDVPCNGNFITPNKAPELSITPSTQYPTKGKMETDRQQKYNAMITETLIITYIRCCNSLA